MDWDFGIILMHQYGVRKSMLGFVLAAKRKMNQTIAQQITSTIH